VRLGAGGSAILRLSRHLLDSLVGGLLLLELLLLMLLQQVGGYAAHALLPYGHLGHKGSPTAGTAVQAGWRVAIHGRRLPVRHIDGRRGGRGGAAAVAMLDAWQSRIPPPPR